MVFQKKNNGRILLKTPELIGEVGKKCVRSPKPRVVGSNPTAPAIGNKKAAFNLF